MIFKNIKLIILLLMRAIRLISSKHTESFIKEINDQRDSTLDYLLKKIDEIEKYFISVQETFIDREKVYLILINVCKDALEFTVDQKLEYNSISIEDYNKLGTKIENLLTTQDETIKNAIKDELKNETFLFTIEYFDCLNNLDNNAELEKILTKIKIKMKWSRNYRNHIKENKRVKYSTNEENENFLTSLCDMEDSTGKRDFFEYFYNAKEYLQRLHLDIDVHTNKAKKIVENAALIVVKTKEDKEESIKMVKLFDAEISSLKTLKSKIYKKCESVKTTGSLLMDKYERKSIIDNLPTYFSTFAYNFNKEINLDLKEYTDINGTFENPYKVVCEENKLKEFYIGCTTPSFRLHLRNLDVIKIENSNSKKRKCDEID